MEHNTYIKGKRCSRCQKVKDHSHFHSNASSTDRKARWCKECVSEYWEAHYRKLKLRTPARFPRARPLDALSRSGALNRYKRQIKQERGQLSCEVCNWHLSGGQSTAVHVHHILPVAQGGANSEENMLLLCPNHHAMAHHFFGKGNSEYNGPTDKDHFIYLLQENDEGNSNNYSEPQSCQECIKRGLKIEEKQRANALRIQNFEISPEIAVLAKSPEEAIILEKKKRQEEREQEWAEGRQRKEEEKQQRIEARKQEQEDRAAAKREKHNSLIGRLIAMFGQSFVDNLNVGDGPPYNKPTCQAIGHLSAKETKEREGDDFFSREGNKGWKKEEN